MRCVVRTADYVFASNAAIASTLRTDYSVEADRLSIIPCGIDTRCFSPHVSRRRLRDALRVSLDDLVCLTVQSSFGIDKGLEPLLRAIACTPLRRRGVVLLVVGHDDTPDQIHMRHLQSVSCELNLGDVVRFVGHKDHGEVADYLQAADVFIDPRLTGNFSSSTLEALYMGKCVIASDTEAARQLVSEGSNGLLVKPGDVDGMAATILACVESVDLRSRLEGAAVEWFAQSGGRYTYQEIARHVAQVYGEISCR